MAFLKAPLNVVDMLAILPYYIGFLLEGLQVFDFHNCILVFLQDSTCIKILLQLHGEHYPGIWWHQKQYNFQSICCAQLQ